MCKHCGVGQSLCNAKHNMEHNENAHPHACATLEVEAEQEGAPRESIEPRCGRGAAIGHVHEQIQQTEPVAEAMTSPSSSWVSHVLQ